MTSKDRLIPVCRVCGCPNTIYLCDTDNEHSKTAILSHFRCNICGSVFVGNEIESEELCVAYSTLDSKKYYEEIVSENRKKMQIIIGHLKDLISPNDRIIDIGTGNGLFVEMLHDAGFENVSAHEIQQDSVLHRVENIVQHMYCDFDYSSILSDSFNAVILLDVFEHVINPKYLSDMCARILKKDGVIYFHTPVVTRADRLMHLVQKTPGLRKAGTIWQRGRTSIFHLENYTPESLTLLLEDAGFRDIIIKVKNERSWPVARYVRTYLLEKQRLPRFITTFLAPFFYPLLASDILNANKAIVSARKAE